MCKGNQTTTTSTAPNPQAGAAYSDLLNRAGQVGTLPYTAYSGELVAPINAQQFSGIGNINANWNEAQPYISQAAGYANAAAAPVSGAQINQYLNPYTQDVVAATEAQFNQQNAQQQSQLTGNAAAQGALGGDRVGVAQGTLAGQQQLAEAPVIAGLETQGYNTALQTALAEQTQQANASYSLGNLGVAGQNAALQGAGAQFGAGASEQQTQQALDAALYGQFQLAQAFPYQQTQWQAGIDTGVGSQMGGTGTTTGPSPSLLGAGLGLGLLGMGMFSDERLKEDIEKIGHANDGQPIYRFRYKGSPQYHIGFLAQEVERRHPEAVHKVGGLGVVDYKSATDDAVHERRHGGIVPGFDFGGGVDVGGEFGAGVGSSPWAGAHGFIPGIGITPGKGPPAPPQPHQDTTNSDLMKLETGILGKNKSGLSGLFGGSDSGSSSFFPSSTFLSADDTSGAGFMSFDRGGGIHRPMVAGFGTGGFVRRHFDDGGGLAGGGTFADRLYASGAPSGNVEDRRRPPTPYERMLAFNHRVKMEAQDKLPFLKYLDFQSPSRSDEGGTLARDAGLYDIPFGRRASSADMPLPDMIGHGYGGKVRGFADGGLADDAGLSDVDRIPIDYDGSFTDRWAGSKQTPSPSIVPSYARALPSSPTTSGLGLDTMVQSTEPGFQNNYGYGFADRPGPSPQAYGEKGIVLAPPESTDRPDSRVLAAQRVLNKWLPGNQGVPQNGVMDDDTAFGISQYQEAHGQKPTGQVEDMLHLAMADTARRPQAPHASAEAPMLPEPSPEAPSRSVAGIGSQTAERPSASTGTSGLGTSSQSSGGLFGFNPFGLSDSARTAMMAAGLGMMASRSPYPAVQIGEGGLKGLASYSESQKQEETKRKDTASIEHARAQLEQAAKRAQQQQDYQNKHLALQEEQLKAGKFSAPVPGMGTGPEGSQVQGAWVSNTKTGESTFHPGMILTGKGSSTPLPAQAWNAHGDDFLKYLPPEKQGLVKGMANYEIDPKTLSVVGGHREDALNWAKQYDPNFDQKTYNLRYNAVNKFATGPQGQNITSLNTTMYHLDTLLQAADALPSATSPAGNVQVLNRLRNVMSSQFGYPEVTNFQGVRDIAADEVVKSVLGTAGSDADRQEMRKSILAAGSPAQLHGIIDRYQDMMAGRLHSLRYTFKDATGLGDEAFDRKLTPETRERLGRLEANVGGGHPGGGAPAAAPAAGGANLPRVNSPAEAARLPRGTRFIDPNGVERVVP